MVEEIFQPASAAAPIQALVAAASPMSFIARDAGTLSIAGGVISVATLARGGLAVSLGLSGGLIPMAAGDKVTITYLTAPTLNFIPR